MSKRKNENQQSRIEANERGTGSFADSGRDLACHDGTNSFRREEIKAWIRNAVEKSKAIDLARAKKSSAGYVAFKGEVTPREKRLEYLRRFLNSDVCEAILDDEHIPEASSAQFTSDAERNLFKQRVLDEIRRADEEEEMSLSLVLSDSVEQMKQETVDTDALREMTEEFVAIDEFRRVAALGRLVSEFGVDSNVLDVHLQLEEEIARENKNRVVDRWFRIKKNVEDSHDVVTASNIIANWETFVYGMGTHGEFSDDAFD